MNIAGVSVVVTGGSDGLGLAVAKQLHSKGAVVHLIARNREALEKAQNVFGDRCFVYACDVSDYLALEQVAAKIPCVDILINNAGVWIEGGLEECSNEKILEVVNINLAGVIFTTKAFLPALRQSPSAYVVNVASTAALRAKERHAVYAATKFGVAGFTEALQQDLAKTNIKVSGFYPGGMRTRLFEKAERPRDLTMYMDPAKVAEIMVFMLERDAPMFMDQVVVKKGA